MTAPAIASFERTDESRKSPVPAHVVVLMNFVPPHRVPMLSELARRVERLTVLLSTPMEPNRAWSAEWGDLDVQLQRTMTFRRPWRHAAGFTDETYLHVPWDTVSRLRALAPDVILSDQLGPRSIFSTCYAAFAKRARLVLWTGMSEHTERGRSRLCTVVRRQLLRRCHAAVINGRSGVRYLEGLGVDPADIFRCPYATSSNFIESGREFRPPTIAHRLLFVGQLVERKGILPFMDVLRKWARRHPDRRVEFDLVGGGPLEPRIRAFAMPDNVCVALRGSLPFHDLSDAYANAGILAIPTLADDWGMVVNEALSMGVPVLGSRYAQAVEDLCIDGVHGWTFRPDIGNEMERALDAALAATPESLNAMRRAGRERVANLTPEFAAEILCEAVQHALSHPRGHAGVYLTPSRTTSP